MPRRNQRAYEAGERTGIIIAKILGVAFIILAVGILGRVLFWALGSL